MPTYCRLLGFFVIAVFAARVANGELVTLTIEPQSFPNPSSVSVFVDAGLLGDDEVESSLSGLVTLDLQPSAINPATAQIVGLQGIVDNAIEFKVGGGFLLPTVTVNSEPGDVQVNMVEPGTAATITDGKFSQIENQLGFSGVVTTSVQDDPLDLGEQPPTLANFEDVELTADRTAIAIGAELISTIAIPFEVGILALDVELDVEGSLIATGEVPAADYLLDVTAPDTVLYSASSGWLRNGVPGTNSLPIAIDRVELSGALEGSLLDLQAETRNASFVSVSSGNVRLRNGVFNTNGLSVATDAVLRFDDTATLAVPAGGSESLEVSGGGHLLIDGASPADLVVKDGVLGGAGQLSSVVLAEQGSLQLTTALELRIAENLVFEQGSSLSITVDAPTAGKVVLATASSIDATLLAADRVLLNDVPYTDTGLHLESGVFGLIGIDSTEIQIVMIQALAGDTDGSGEVDFSDFLRLSAAFGMSGDWTNGDFDGSGLVEFADFLALSANFGDTVAGAASVPEPTGCLLTLCGLSLTILRRRRDAA